ncbi:hypothetical protein MMC12_006092 [Toensbergia leucococca]|nr:hypothetical protein [Toensbergia leucococca]
MAKRAPKSAYAKINNCILRTPNGKPVTRPAYPDGNNFLASDKITSLGTLTTVSRYYKSAAFGAPACTPTITRLQASEWTSERNNGKVVTNDEVTVDHAYEIHFLKGFMESVIDQQNGLTCPNATEQFFTTGDCADNRLAPIFDSLPSYKNPDFIVMSQWLNGVAKAYVLGPEFDLELRGSFLPGKKVRPLDD